MDISLDLSRDCLALYTPPPPPSIATGSRLVHTRSVLLYFGCERLDAAPVILDGLSFVLVFSVSERVHLDRLLQFMLVTYNQRRYSKRSKEAVQAKHATLHLVEEHLLSKETKAFIEREDMQNVDDFLYCQEKTNDIFGTWSQEKLAFWKWYPAGSQKIDDNRYRWMKNINFIREVTEISVKRPAKGEKQYRIVFDNHVILYFFLLLFRREFFLDRDREDENGDPIPGVRVTLLEPLDVAHDVFHGEDYIRYVEKQLDRREQKKMSLHLSFSESITLAGGLLQPAYFDREDLYLSCVNTPEEMYQRRIVEDVNRRKNKRDPNVVSFELAYNRLYIDMSQWQVVHVNYKTRTKHLMRQDETKTVKNTASSSSSESSLDTASKERAKKAAAKLTKNQPTLGLVVGIYRYNHPGALMIDHDAIAPVAPVIAATTTTTTTTDIVSPVLVKKSVKKSKKRKKESNEDQQSLLTLFETQKKQKLEAT